jgi:hypothetical protein
MQACGRCAAGTVESAHLAPSSSLDDSDDESLTSDPSSELVTSDSDSLSLSEPRAKKRDVCMAEERSAARLHV